MCPRCDILFIPDEQRNNALIKTNKNSRSTRENKRKLVTTIEEICSEERLGLDTDTPFLNYREFAQMARALMFIPWICLVSNIVLSQHGYPQLKLDFLCLPKAGWQHYGFKH